jgi:hypothetical protein
VNWLGLWIGFTFCCGWIAGFVKRLTKLVEPRIIAFEWTSSDTA